MHRPQLVIVTTLIITLMLRFSAAHISANHQRLQIPVSTLGNETATVKEKNFAHIVSPAPKQSVLSTDARRRITQKRPTPTNTPIPTKAQTPVDTANISLTDAQKFMLQAVNSYRSSKALQNVTVDKYTCDFAATRAKEIVGNFNHTGFQSRVDNKSLPYPSYRSVTENIATTQDYKKVVDMWITSPGHAENMRKDTPFVCVAQHDNYFVYEGWKP